LEQQISIPTGDNPKAVFQHFLKQHFPAESDKLLKSFGLYLEELYTINHQINLVSRQMPLENYWLYHFLDSLLIVNYMEITGGKALDFGSGGGLPGIPLKLVFPQLKMTLLDSVGKKVKCLERIIEVLQLKDCQAVWSRLEDYAKTKHAGSFDYIFCRSVKLETGFIEPISKLLKPEGKAVFYKAQNIDDVSVLPEINIYDVSLPIIGKRQIVTASKRSFEKYMKNKRVG